MIRVIGIKLIKIMGVRLTCEREPNAHFGADWKIVKFVNRLII